MNVIIPPKRRDGASSFMKLVAYISVRDGKPASHDVVPDEPQAAPSQSNQAVFDRLVDYIDRSGTEDAHLQVTEEFDDGRQRLMCGDVPCETNCFSWETAAAEMNMVASQNRRCLDPVYHFILSWREHEVPTPEQVFESAQHCINELGLEGHQYVTAIHQDTDNLHCHVAVNRVNPVTFKAANMWNDADTLQKSCRVLERRFGFEQDNGSWEWSSRDTLVPAPFRFQPAPQGAAKTQIYSDKESLFHYAVRTVRDEADQAMAKGEANWDKLHLVLHVNGLGLREQGGGLVVFDSLRPDAQAVKASSIHPSLTKARLEPIYGGFEGPPPFEGVTPLQARYGVFETYQPKLHLRDKDARLERREERAEARVALKARYQEYRKGWVKPDLNILGRQKNIALRYQAMKANVRTTFGDPLLRKLMYRVAEFERMKAMAELRIQIRKERQLLSNKGLSRPLSYRLWVEQEALRGDDAAISQLRGWAYREKRQERIAGTPADRVIVFGQADDSALLDSAGHAAQLRRDGTIEYLRYGRVAVVDRGDQVEIKAGFDDVDEMANYNIAADIVSTKSGDVVEVFGDSQFVDHVLEAGTRLNYHTGEILFSVTEQQQQARYTYLQSYDDQPNHHEQDDSAPQEHDEDIPRGPGPKL